MNFTVVVDPVIVKSISSKQFMEMTGLCHQESVYYLAVISNEAFPSFNGGEYLQNKSSMKFLFTAVNDVHGTFFVIISIPVHGHHTNAQSIK